MKRTVNVTQELIDKGERFACGKCPVALALSETFPECRGFYVSSLHITYYVNGAGMPMLETPEVAREFIIEYDWQNKPPQPFSFDIDLPLKNELVEA